MTLISKKIPTNVITGFLGVGKTTAIAHLLSIKPAHERWAVLVNEFGEIGIDASLLQGQHSHSQESFIAEIPGGCMCCVMGLPTRVALNRLIQQARPDRLLIEPSGLGHPQEVLELLNSEHYKDVLDVRTTITLVDARDISNPRYTKHEIFNQQIKVANLIVANKRDCYDGEIKNLLTYLEHLRPNHSYGVEAVVNGKISIDWLDQVKSRLSLEPHETNHHHHHHHHQHHHEDDLVDKATQKLPVEGYLEITNHKGEYYSRGWLFEDHWVFDESQLAQALTSLPCERMKGVFVTNLGAFGYSLSQGELSVTRLSESQGNRIELIDQDQTQFDGVLSELLMSQSQP